MTLPDLLRAEIARRGPIPFRDFMARALYDPEHGYYTSGRAAIGRKGDFFTNVSVGALFGQLLARQFEEVWVRLDRPERFTIVEQGAFRGDFAADVLAHLRQDAPELHSRLEYVIIEPSPRSRRAQAESLEHFTELVRWIASANDLAPFVGVHFSNELIDAFPIHRVIWAGSEWHEQYVGYENEHFVWVEGSLSRPELAPHLARLPTVPVGYRTEINLEALTWIETLAARLARGLVLAIDYGFPREEYFRADRTDGTLSAYAAHRREPDPLARPGEIDLTAHAEFTSLAERAETSGLEVAGFTDQHHFIVGLSQLHFHDAEPNPAGQKELRALQTLMHPALMGRSFKALALAKRMGEPARLSGFQFGSDPRTALGLTSPS